MEDLYLALKFWLRSSVSKEKKNCIVTSSIAKYLDGCIKIQSLLPIFFSFSHF